MPKQQPPGRTRRAVTIQDVAVAAGVSNMTVSNVINERDDRVSSATRERVLQTMKRLGYRVNVSARQLRQGRTGVVGLAVPYLGSPYYGELADRLVDRFATRGLRLVVERTGGALTGELEALAVSHLDAYDGLVLMVTQGESQDLDRVSPSKPVVLIGERALSSSYDHVLMDNVRGARAATRHLLDTGSRRIALIGGAFGDENSMPTLRTQGYVKAHEQTGVPVDERLIFPAQFAARDGYATVQRMLETGLEFDAVFALTDDSAMGVLAALYENRVTVPDSVQVIGWDDVSWGRHMSPTLSTVNPANDAIADHVARLLQERIEGFQGDGRVVTPPSTLVLRASTR